AQRAARASHRNDQGAIVHADAMSTDALCGQIRMVRCRLRPSPYLSGTRRGLSVPSGFLLLSSSAHRLNALAVHAPLLGRELATEVGAPRFRNTGAPAAERARGDAVVVQDVPAAVIASPTVCREAMQRSVCDDLLRHL